MSIQLTTLPSGLRIITDTVPTVDSVAVGVWASVGTRNEDLKHNGVAHMVEHMVFKGTPTRSAQDIAEQIENAGGHMNAYTSREVTSYHVHLLKDDLKLALDLISDIVQHSAMPEEEIVRERHVILQEIGMTYDTPDDFVFDLYQETAYPGQALGAPILGTAEIVANMPREALYDYVHRFYTPSRLVVSAAGNLNHQEVVRQVEDLFGDLPADSSHEIIAADYKGGESRETRELEQSHFVLGFQGLAQTDDDHETAMILSTILGGGMSSRLFQEIREKRGLVYSIFSYHTGFHDDGQMEIYAGTGPDDLPELVPVLCEEICKVVDDISEEELVRAKAQRRSTLLMGRESMMSRADRQAKSVIYKGQGPDLSEKLKKIDAINKDEVCSIARKIFSSRPTLAALGPLDKLEDYESVRARLAV